MYHTAALSSELLPPESSFSWFWLFGSGTPNLLTLALINESMPKRDTTLLGIPSITCRTPVIKKYFKKMYKLWKLFSNIFLNNCVL